MLYMLYIYIYVVAEKSLPCLQDLGLIDVKLKEFLGVNLKSRKMKTLVVLTFLRHPVPISYILLYLSNYVEQKYW